MRVSELMTEALVTIGPDDTVRTALLRMDDQQVRHLPVVEGTKLLGMVSDRDLREYRLPVVEEIDNPDLAGELLDTPVVEVMSETLITLEPGESVRTAIDLMLEYGVGAVPVLASEGAALVGIVSYVDVLEALRRALDD